METAKDSKFNLDVNATNTEKQAQISLRGVEKK